MEPLQLSGLLVGAKVDDQTRANLVSQWAQMDSSGIDPLRAMQTLRDAARGSAGDALSEVLNLLNRGVAPADAWVRAGLLRDWQGQLLATGFSNGRGEWALQSLARDLVARAARWRAFQARMLFPLAILVLAGFLSALPPLVASQIGFLGFLFRILLAPAIVVGCIVMAVRLLQASQDSGAARTVVSLPLIGSWLQRRTRADFLAMTAQSLKAGMPARQAVLLAAGAVRPVVHGRRYAKVAALIDAGQPLADAMLNGQVLDATGYSLVNTGEQSGALDDMLERVAGIEERAANEQADAITAWAPRLIYIAIAGMMVLSVVGFWSSYSPAG